MVGTPHRSAFFFSRLSVNWLTVASMLRTVAVEYVHHVLQPMPRAEPAKIGGVNPKGNSIENEAEVTTGSSERTRYRVL